MSPTRSPTLRDLHLNRHVQTRPRPRPSRRTLDAWIAADPDLAPAPRRECPLTVWT